jgi:hypothetical protein
LITRRVTVRWVIGAGLLAALIAARFAFADAFTKSTRVSTAAPAMTQPPSLAALATTGTRVDAVFLERSPVAGRRFTATLLRRDRLGAYHRTSSKIAVVWQHSPVPVEMGDPAALRTGAVLQVSGRYGPTHTLLASRIVVLSGYVRIA